jgi:hypothetical protein
MMKEETPATLTIGLWFLSAIVLVALFISAAAQGELTPSHIVFASILLGVAVVGTPLLLRRKGSAEEQDKQKRQRIDSLLSDLSDDDLMELKHRLADLDSGEPPVVDYVGDDGELVMRR